MAKKKEVSLLTAALQKAAANGQSYKEMQIEETERLAKKTLIKWRAKHNIKKPE